MTLDGGKYSGKKDELSELNLNSGQSFTLN